MSGSANDHPLDRLSAYLDDELDVGERAGIDRHLASCEDCRSSLEALRRLSRAIAEEAVPPVPVELAARVGSRLDEATVVRPRRWRLALPATIAATISAIGILVAIQMREGRLTPEVADAVSTATPPPAQAPKAEGGERKEKDVEVLARTAPALEPAPAPVPPPPAAAPMSAAPSVVGGAVGGVEEGISAGRERADEDRIALSDAPQRENAPDRERLARDTAALPEPVAKAASSSTCAGRWSDSGARGTWEVADPVATARELNNIAHAVGGIGLWWGVTDGRPYLLIVPRDRYAEIFDALKARGIAGLAERPMLAAGDDCTALSITIVQAR